MKDHEIVNAFVAYLRDNGYSNLRINRRPEKENRESKDIDAIVGQFAIEHTFVPRFKNQKAQDDWFYTAMAGLEFELPTSPYQLNISSDFYDIRKGQNWSEIRNAVKTWIIQEAPRLADGEYILDNVPGTPFHLKIEKLSNVTPGIFFLRRLPDDKNKLNSLEIYKQLNLKIGKLIPYKKDGFTTVLLIEGNLTRNKMLHTIKLAFPDGLHPDLDEIWYVPTWGKHIGQFTKLAKWDGNKNDG